MFIDHLLLVSSSLLIEAFYVLMQEMFHVLSFMWYNLHAVNSFVKP
jgi:hypothetical protein